MQEYKPNERIVDRAAHLWRRLLEHPHYDNGDNSFAGFVSQTMVAALHNNSTADRLAIFEVKLRERLMAPDERGKFWGRQCLSVDYGPDENLHWAAEQADLRMQFPWKTTMHLNENHLSLRAGYSGQYVYHYPLDGDRWLVTTLSGSDIDKVIEYVNGGSPTFEVQSESTVTAHGV